MRKRSKSVAITLLGATAFALAGCREDKVEAQAFPDLASCHIAAAAAEGTMTAQDCDTAFQDAEKLHVETAPRYDSLQVCEEQHGVGNCGSEAQQTSGGGSGIFMPLLAGYLIGNMLGGRMGGGMAPAQPMYHSANGGYSTANGAAKFSGNSGKTQMSASSFARPSTTVGKPPMSRATAASRGGFGASRSSGFGG